MTLPAELRRTYHLADVDPSHPIRRAADDLDRLEAERDDALRRLQDEECAHMRAEIERLRTLLAEARGALLEVRAHLHAAGRRPETCHEMSVIDEALMTLRSER